MSWTQFAPGTKFHPNLPKQNPNSVWCYGTGNAPARNLAAAPHQGTLRRAGHHARLQQHAGRPRAGNGGFGRNETQLHFHNAHNGAESDGAANAHHFPGTFYDYRWSTTLARRDKINHPGHRSARSARGPTAMVASINVPGDFREIQGTMWAHDHRFFFTAENVYKGNLMMVNYVQRPRSRQRGARRRRQSAAAERQSCWTAATSIST